MSQPLPKYATAARFDRSTVDMAADRPILERSDLVLACAHVLHTNGQSTHETVQAAERLGTQLCLLATVIAHWEELELRAADGTGSQVSFERGSPTGMNMDRVPWQCLRSRIVLSAGRRSARHLKTSRRLRTHHRLQPGCLRSLQPRVLPRWRRSSECTI